MQERAAVTVGSFDGVHRGHAALLDAARRAVGASADGGRVTALAFFPHPMTTLRPEKAPPRVTNWPQRVELLRAGGADEVVRLQPAPELLSLEPRAFIERIVQERRPRVWVEGPDFRFGKSRRGDVDLLERCGREFGFETIIVPEQEIALHDLTLAPASSTLVRWLLAHGRLADVRCVLGRSYEIRGRVAPGDQRGREIGFPTANIDAESMPPADGVYAGMMRLPDGRDFAAAISVGLKPTFGERPRTVEAYVIGWDGRLNGVPAEYGWEARLTFQSWLRGQARYDDLSALIAQIGRDVERTIDLMSRTELSGRV